jgi:hypothetical protein
MSNSENGNKVPLLVLALVVAVWGVLGALDINKDTQIGYDTDGNNTVTQVFDGPAKAAGLQVGDYIISINGVSTEDTAGMLNMSRAEVGEVRTWVVRRDGAEVSLDIAAGPLLPRTKMLGWAATLLGFCFLGFTLAAYFAQPSGTTRVLAFMGAGVGLAFMGGPYIESGTLLGVTVSVRQLIVFLGIASLVHFLLLFPNPRDFLSKGNAKIILFAPAVLLALLVAYRFLLTPASTDTLNNVFRVAFGVVIGGYLVTSLVLMWQNHSRASAEDKASKGLNMMLWGTVLGFLPVVINIVTNIVSPQTVLPGSDYYFLTMVLIPITWSVAARKAGS